MSAVSGPALVHHRGSYGNAVLTRWPVKAVRRVEIGVIGREPRAVLDTDIEVAGFAVRVVVTHFGLRNSERRLQTEMLVRMLGPRGRGLHDPARRLQRVGADGTHAAPTERGAGPLARRAQLSVAAPGARARPDLGAARHRARALRAHRSRLACCGVGPSSRARRGAAVKVTARAKRIARWTVTAAFFAAVVWLLQDELRELDPREIVAVAARTVAGARRGRVRCSPPWRYAVVASYDRLSARYARVRLPAALGFAIPFVSYAFNFNIGAMVGAAGIPPAALLPGGRRRRSGSPRSPRARSSPTGAAVCRCSARC